MTAIAVLLITEIMFNPASSETGPAGTEWVEVYNPGEAAIDMAGWYLADEDARSLPIPEGFSLKPGQAVVLIPDSQTEAGFHSAWGDKVRVLRLGGWVSLANSPSEDNEDLTLVRPDGTVSDEVNYDDAGDWPSDSPDGPSIYLLPDFLDAKANDRGNHWARSEPGKHGARHANETEAYSAEDVGSPGTVAVPAGTEQPGQPKPTPTPEPSE